MRQNDDQSTRLRTNPLGLNADQIATNPVANSSSWHFFQAVSWLDYAKRIRAPSALHYAAFEFRYGVEYLLFELFVLGHKTITEKEYRKCIGDPKAMKKALQSSNIEYDKLADFTRILLSLDSNPLKLRFWKLETLFRYWGIASELLHFVGAHPLTYESKTWFDETLARMEKEIIPVWEIAQTTRGLGLLDKATMEPEVREAWLDFSKGKLDEDSLKRRMRIAQPTLAARRRSSIILPGQ